MIILALIVILSICNFTNDDLEEHHVKNNVEYHAYVEEGTLHLITMETD